MSRWTTPKDLIDQTRRLWDSGRLLADRLDSDSQLFPLRLRLGRPRPGDLVDQFDAVRTWVAELLAGSCEQRGHGYAIEWREINHRVVGRNRMPVAIVLPSADDALRLIGKTRQAQRFEELAADLLAEFPVLQSWLVRRPLVALNHLDDWPRLLAILHYFQQRPRPGIFLRQLDIPGVDTKFIENRRRLLSELLDVVLPGGAIDPTAIGARGFNQRYGLKNRPALLRFRMLDPTLRFHGLSDLSVPAAEFNGLDLAVDTMFITENEINGLVFPDHPRAIVIFGLGYGLDRLADIDWLRRLHCWYWGDIDTHGFAILNRLRHYFPQARSFLMDRTTLDAHRDLWGQEPADRRYSGELDQLDKAEQALYRALRDDHLGPRIRLEQEHVRFTWLKRFLASLGNLQDR